MLKYAKKAARKQWSHWVKRRIPAQQRVKLDQRSIFILPSKEGIIFIVSVLALFIGGINYVNSLILTMAFFLTSLMLVAILHTYRNLQGLIFTSEKSEPSFVGDFVRYTVIINTERKDAHEGILLQLQGAAEVRCCVDPHQSNKVNLFIPARRRGVQKPGRLLVQTKYPLGIMRAWSWIDLELAALVYPAILEGEQPKSDNGVDDREQSQSISGVDDFSGLNNYQEGDPLSRVYWKVLARGLPLATKSFEQPVSESCWISINRVPGALEQQLSILAYWVLKLSESRAEFGLDLGSVQIQPSRGPQHKKQCLKALALHGLLEGDVVLFGGVQ